GPKNDYGTAVGPYSVVIGNLNRDPIPDIAVANVGSNTISVLLGNGDGTFGVKTDYGTGNNPNGLAIGNLSGGFPDLVTSNHVSNTVTVLINKGGTLSIGPEGIPSRFDLAPPWPNPFHALATLEFVVPISALVRLEIYDLQGRRIRTLQDGILEPGRYTRSWDGLTRDGAAARTGVYFARFSAPG